MSAPRENSLPWTLRTVLQILPHLLKGFALILEGFHKTFAIGVVHKEGALTPPNTQFRPIWKPHMLFLLRQFFLRTLHF